MEQDAPVNPTGAVTTEPDLPADTVPDYDNLPTDGSLSQSDDTTEGPNS